MPDITDMRTEVDEMRDVLMGRVGAPVDIGVSTLMEVASAFYARALEMTQLIQRGEVDGAVLKNGHLYKFRTGELRTFLELAKNAYEAGSRRLTAVEMEMRYGA